MESGGSGLWVEKGLVPEAQADAVRREIPMAKQVDANITERNIFGSPRYSGHALPGVCFLDWAVADQSATATAMISILPQLGHLVNIILHK